MGRGATSRWSPRASTSVVVVDLNYAYNPYCAYNPDWSCPIPPGENWLAVPIRAGEKSFPGAYEVAIA